HAPAVSDSLARARALDAVPVARQRAAAAGLVGRRPVRVAGGPARVMTALPPTAQDQNGFIVELEQFSGPLDLLLHLIREDEVDITDLPIAKIADQFLAVISELGLNQAADYLEMAARLLRIKAQMLLPRRLGDDEWEDPRAELVRRLLEYQQIRELVEWLGAAAARRAEQFGRGFSPEPPTVPPAPLVIDLNDLLAAAERVIALIPEPVLHRVVPRPLDVEGATARIEALLAERAALGWGDVVGERPTIVDVLSAFIALLELAKRGALRPRRLSPAALETLAIVAYRQPVGRSEVDEIRGVDSGAVIDKLAERGLVEVVTRGEGLGRPLLYGTTPQFLEILGLKDLDELPRLEELSVALRPPAPAEPA